MATLPQIRENRRLRANRAKAMRASGMLMKQVAHELGISVGRLAEILPYASDDGPELFRTTTYVSPFPDVQPVVVTKEATEPHRPAWSYPDRYTLAIVHEIRDEMIQAGARKFK